MSRPGRPPKPWLKLYTSILTSSINTDFSPDERWYYVALLALAGRCNRGGVIADNDGKPYNDAYLAHALYTDIPTFKSILKKCIDTNRCRVNGAGIEILNWSSYQSEYNRQKVYRDQKGGPEKLRDYDNQSRQEIVVKSTDDIKRRKDSLKNG